MNLRRNFLFIFCYDPTGKWLWFSARDIPSGMEQDIFLQYFLLYAFNCKHVGILLAFVSGYLAYIYNHYF